MYEHNPLRNPESIRIEQLRKDQEQHALQARKLAEIETPRKVENRAEIIRFIVDRAHPNRSKEWREARVKELLGVPAADSARKPVKKATKADRAKLDTINKEINKRIAAANKQIAAFYGIKDPGEIQYR